MADPVSLGVVLSVGALGAFVTDVFKTALKDFGKAPVKKALEAAAARFEEGQLPPNHDLDKALRTALAQATRVLAYHLHDPGRKSLGQLLENFSDWPDLAHRLLEVTQNNILAGTATDHWLAHLIEESKEPGNFKDLPLDLVLADHSLTRLLEDKSDQTVKQAIHDRFLAWVDWHVPDNGGKPQDFAASVANGWPVGKGGARLSFYDVVCVFFREQLKGGDKVFRAFTANVLTGLKGDLAEIRAALPDPATLQRFTDTLAAFEEKEFDANYARFKQHLKRQNDKVLTLLREEFAAVHEHLGRQDQTLATVEQTTAAHRQEAAAGHGWLRHRLGWVVAGVGLVLAVVLTLGWQQQRSLARLDALVKRDAPGSELLREFRQRLDGARFATAKAAPDEQVTAVLAELARDQNLTVDALRLRLLQAAANAEERLTLTGQLRRAAEQETRRLREFERDAHAEMAVGSTLAGRLPDALRHYQLALALTDRVTEPQQWANLQHSVGGIHRDLGIRVAGQAAREHLLAAVTAYRAALEVATHKELPQAWAAAQNNLGNALREHARRSEGAQSVRLMGESVTAYRAALEVYTRAISPQKWAAVQNNLAVALSDQAENVEGPDAIRLLDESVSAYRATLEVYNRSELPQEWARAQCNLALAISDKARRTDGLETPRLLDEAIAAYRAALEVRTRANQPQEWARTQNNLANALSDQAGRSEGGLALQRFGEAVTAYRASLEVLTRLELPQYWAAIQNNLGVVLHDQAARSGGTNVVPLLGEAVAAFRAALEVRTRIDLPREWAETCANLANALIARAEHSESGEPARQLGEAIAVYRATLEVFTQDHFPQQYAIVTGNVATAEAALAKLRGNSSAR